LSAKASVKDALLRQCLRREDVQHETVQQFRNFTD
jgi:hypothetical protein